MAKKVVTLGEIMLRLSTPDFKRFVQADSFDVTYGGGEANVAAALCNYGLQGTFVSKVPDNAIGQAAINHLRRYGVDTICCPWRKAVRHLFFRNGCLNESIPGYLRSC